MSAANQNMRKWRYGPRERNLRSGHISLYMDFADALHVSVVGAEIGGEAKPVRRLVDSGKFQPAHGGSVASKLDRATRKGTGTDLWLRYLRVEKRIPAENFEITLRTTFRGDDEPDKN